MPEQQNIEYKQKPEIRENEGGFMVVLYKTAQVTEESGQIGGQIGGPIGGPIGGVIGGAIRIGMITIYYQIIFLLLSSILVNKLDMLLVNLMPMNL